MEKGNVFISAALAEIKSIVTRNGRSIADNSIKIDMMHDDVKDIKKETDQIRKDILAMRKLNLEMKEISLEMRKTNYEIRLLLDEAIANNERIRRDIDKIYPVADVI